MNFFKLEDKSWTEKRLIGSSNLCKTKSQHERKKTPNQDIDNLEYFSSCCFISLIKRLVFFFRCCR